MDGAHTLVSLSPPHATLSCFFPFVMMSQTLLLREHSATTYFVTTLSYSNVLQRSTTSSTTTCSNGMFYCMLYNNGIDYSMLYSKVLLHALLIPQGVLLQHALLKHSIIEIQGTHVCALLHSTCSTT